MKTSAASMRRRARSSRGQTLAEFAMILPVFTLLIFGVIDFARMIQTYVTIQHSAREGARYAVTGRSDCGAASPSRLACIEYIVERESSNLHNFDSLDVNIRSWAYQEGGYAATPTDDSAGIQCDNVEVAVTYDYEPMTPGIMKLFGTIPLAVSERLLNEPFGACGTVSG
ncbi:MAG: TadE family protein [Dehalococcoidia bacterium]